MNKKTKLNCVCLLAIASLLSGCYGGDPTPEELHGNNNGGGGTAVLEDPGSSSSANNQSGGTRPAQNSNLPAVAMQRIPAAVASATKVEFRIGEGEEVFSFKPKEDDSCKLYDAEGIEQCKLTLNDGVLKVKTADDKPLFQLKPKDSKVMIKDATGENELFKFKIKGDTIDFYLPGDVRTYRIKKKDYGWRLEDNNDNTLYRAKVKDGRTVLRNAADETVLYTNDYQSPLSLVFFKMEELTPEQQAACCLYFMEH